MLKSILCLVISLFFLASTITGLAITMRYSYFENLWHYHEGYCHADCRRNDYTTTCCTGGRNKYCETCTRTDYFIDIGVIVNDTVYATTLIRDGCVPENTTCYYDDRDIVGSLSVDYQLPDASIVGISFLSFFLLIVIISTSCSIFNIIAQIQPVRLVEDIENNL